MEKLKKWMKIILDLIYPPRCPVCHDIIEAGYDMLCSGCVKKLPLVPEPCCKKCGKPIKQQEEYCHDCMTYEHEFVQGTSVFLYDEVMRSSMVHFKYLGRREYGRFYGASIWQFRRELILSWSVEVIIPVPVHSTRLAIRGYNQAEVIARELGKRMNLPIVSDAVIRSSKTRAQKELTPDERRKNLENAFVKGKNPFHWKRVLLIDDIFTTGSTTDAVSKVLKEQGAEEIYVVSVCIGRGFVV